MACWADDGGRWLAKKHLCIQRRSTARHGHPRRLSTMSVPHVEEQWTHAPWHTVASLSWLWPAVRLVRRAIPPLGGHAASHQARAGGADLLAWLWSCGGRHTQVISGFSVSCRSARLSWVATVESVSRGKERLRSLLWPFLRPLCSARIDACVLPTNTCLPTPCPLPVTATRTPVIVCAKTRAALMECTTTCSEGVFGDARRLHAGLQLRVSRCNVTCRQNRHTRYSGAHVVPPCFLMCQKPGARQSR
jgi:hypothetical protein